ncbi:hypothetical protein [Myroides pelagicus]|uniref:Uncharacterized protein n=1 Tax=Myroides pelagicus TaxID=270914 RepID=A0A7K1GTH5_9FLAO|nr:hypothetical protein [Myroides pelagicus]MTH31014.1 hypothetical protein [Myroides pelagicus]
MKKISLKALSNVMGGEATVRRIAQVTKKLNQMQRSDIEVKLETEITVTVES